MNRLALVVILIAASLGTGFGENRSTKPKGVVVAFFDQERLQYGGGPAAFQDFKYFYKLIREIADRDFPDVELKVLKRGELVGLPDGTRLNVQTVRPELGFVFAAPGRKRRMLAGVQSDADFACAASEFFHRRSPACPE